MDEAYKIFTYLGSATEIFLYRMMHYCWFNGAIRNQIGAITEFIWPKLSVQKCTLKIEIISVSLKQTKLLQFEQVTKKQSCKRTKIQLQLQSSNNLLRFNFPHFFYTSSSFLL